MSGVWHDSTGTAHLLGLQIHRGPDAATVSMRVAEDHTNRHGRMHSGLISTVLDTAMGATASLARGEKKRILANFSDLACRNP